MANPPETLETPIADEGRARLNPQRLALLIGGALLIFVLVWFFFLRSGGETPPPENLPALTTPQPTDTAAPDDQDDGDRGRVETFEVFAARDPFEPLAGEEVGEAPDEGSGGDTGDDGGTDGGTDDGTDGGIDTGDGDDGDAGGGGGETVGDHRVRVVDVFPRGGRAQVQVDGTVYTVDEGETFAENFELIRASGQCATMLFGDDEFTLCEGEEILK